MKDCFLQLTDLYLQIKQYFTVSRLRVELLIRLLEMTATLYERDIVLKTRWTLITEEMAALNSTVNVHPKRSSFTSLFQYIVCKRWAKTSQSCNYQASIKKGSNASESYCAECQVSVSFQNKMPASLMGVWKTSWSKQQTKSEWCQLLSACILQKVHESQVQYEKQQ